MQFAKSLEVAVRLQTNGRLAEAEKIYAEILAAEPNQPDALHLSGVIALQSGRLEEAHQRIHKAIGVNPNVAEYYNNFGNVFVQQGKIGEAIAAFRKATILRPSYPKAFSNFGNALKKAGQFELATAAYQKAVALAPNYLEAKWNLGLLQLLQGDFAQGWAGFEQRLEIDEIRAGKRQFKEPRWNGEALNGKRILLHVEQGFGDTMQFARYASLVADRGGKVALEVPPELSRLFTGLRGVETIVARGELLPEFDIHCPLLSLPMVFGTTLATIPNSVPYLLAPNQLFEQWSHKFSAYGNRLKVGLAWAGNPRQRNDRNRSMQFDQLCELTNISGIDFFSLQVGPAAAQGATSKHFARVNDLTGELKDFADTAGLIQCLDLVVSVDTAVAHLAGALGKPVWVPLAFVPDWRWHLNRADSPWYPTMRLFRQAKPGDWSAPMREIAIALDSMRARSI